MGNGVWDVSGKGLDRKNQRPALVMVFDLILNASIFVILIQAPTIIRVTATFSLMSVKENALSLDQNSETNNKKRGGIFFMKV